MGMVGGVACLVAAEQWLVGAADGHDEGAAGVETAARRWGAQGRDAAGDAAGQAVGAALGQGVWEMLHPEDRRTSHGTFFDAAAARDSFRGASSMMLPAYITAIRRHSAPITPRS